MVQTGEPVFISDTASNPHWMSLDGKEGLTLQRSYVGAPIRVKDLTVGFLNVSSSEPGRFGPDTARRLQAFADHAAAALENAQLYQALRTHAEGLEDRVQERTAQLEAQHAWQEAILQSTSNGIIVADTKGKILQANPVAKKWLQRALLPEDSAQLRKAIQQLAKRAQEHPEMMLELKGLDLELRAAPISNPYAGNATAVVAVHDVSHLKALDRMKTRFVSNVSHELRTPVTTIKLYASLLQRSPPEKWKDYVDALAQEADRQAQLVESILHVSKIDAGRLELDLREVSLNELVETVVFSHQFLAERKDLILRYQGTAREPLVLVDSRQMMQVLNNLLENSIRYTPQGGTVVISTGTNQEDGRIWATVLVEDSGVGIPEVELPHIFERFFRGEEPREMQISGTGLGLAIAKEIIELHGGQIKVESQVGQGSTFFVSLPLIQPHPHSQR